MDWDYRDNGSAAVQKMLQMADMLGVRRILINDQRVNLAIFSIDAPTINIILRRLRRAR